MVEHQIHYGKKFYQDKQTGYWISTTCPKIRAHVWVWNQFHGEVPKGMHIHHKDENKSNNSFENLKIMHYADHAIHHSRERMRDPIFRQKIIDNCNKARPLTKEWHASKEGRAWHSLHAIKNNFGNWDPIKYICLICNKEYLSKVRGKDGTKFCSNNCKSQHRRNNKLDHIEKECVTCSKKFFSNKYNKIKNCSRACGQVSAIKNLKLKNAKERYIVSK